MEYMEPWETSANWELGWTRKPATCKTEIQVRRELGNQETHEQEKTRKRRNFGGKCELAAQGREAGSNEPGNQRKKENRKIRENWRSGKPGKAENWNLEN